MSEMPSRKELNAYLKHDLVAFVHRCFQTLDTDPYLHNWHIEAIAHQLNLCRQGRTRRLLITQPPRSLKSICVSIAYVAWMIGRDPSVRFICVSYSADLAGTLARQFRTVVESDWYRELFPNMRPLRDTGLELVTTAGGGRLAVSVGGSLTGRGADIIIIDDPMKAEDAVSKTARDNLRDWYRSTLATRLNDKNRGQIIVVMQRLHEDDLAGYLLENGDWAHLDLPAIAIEPQRIELGHGEVKVREPGDLLHPERESLETLDVIKKEIGSFSFSAQFQQQPVPIEGNIVKRAWIGNYTELPSRDDNAQIVQSWDTASKAGELNDFSVCTTWLVVGSDYYLVDVFRARLEYPLLKLKSVELAKRFGANVVLVEDAGSGTQLVQDLRYARARLRPIPIKPTKDKITRMSNQSATFEAGQVRLPAAAPWLDTFVTELLGFPNAKHDDQVDSVSQFLQWVNNRRGREAVGEIRLNGWGR